VLLEAANAAAYCRKTTCKDCVPAAGDACVLAGQPLFWSGACVSYSLSRAASGKVSKADAAALVAQAFDTWQNATCGLTGEHPSIHVSDAFGRTSCNLAEYSRTGANANVVLFRDDVWPYDGAENAVGLTTMNFDPLGQIYDADIEVNGTVDLSTTDEVPMDHYDLLSILTHEAGHFLGLAHSQDQDAVMRPTYMSGTSSLRVLSADDIAGICAIYPPERHTPPCDFTPRGGFASECPLGVFRGGCAIGPVGRPAPSPGAAWTLIALGGALALRRGAEARKAASQGRRGPCA
jgi:hypothetical protein